MLGMKGWMGGWLNGCLGGWKNGCGWMGVSAWLSGWCKDGKLNGIDEAMVGWRRWILYRLSGWR